MSQGPEGKARDIWAKLGQTLRSGAETIVHETKELTRLGKLKVELMSLENERDRKLEDIGRSANALRKSGAAFPTELSELFAAVDGVEARIEEKRQEVEKLRAEDAEAKQKAASKPPEEKPSCPECGAEIRPGDVFCAKCGARVA